MRILFTSLLCICSFAQTSAAVPAGQPFTIAISAEAPAEQAGPDSFTVKSGTDLFVTVKLTNTSTHNISIGDDSDSRTGVDFFNLYEIRDSNGNLVPKRKINHPEVGSTGHGWPARILKPRASMDVASDRITGMYDLMPGEYTIQVSRALQADPKDGMVKSNLIKVSVAK